MNVAKASPPLSSKAARAAILSLRNRQRLRKVNTSLLRKIVHDVLGRLQVSDFELAIHLVESVEMARVNWTYLKHEGSTDVITFDYSGEDCRMPALSVSRKQASGSRIEGQQPPVRLHGEIFICVADALKQAREFRTSWESELVRYAIHGLLHLCGYDDLKPALRRVMKREENRLLKLTEEAFDLRRLSPRGK